METSNIINLIVAVIGGGGLATAIAILVKLRPEAGAITVSTAQDVLKMQSDILLQLKADLEDCRRECQKERAAITAEYQRLLLEATTEIADLKANIIKLRASYNELAAKYEEKL